MNDPSQIMNQAKMMGLSQAQVMSQMAQSSQPQMMSQSQAMAAQQQQSQLMMMTGQSQPPILNRSYKVWSQQQQQQLPPLDPNIKFQSQNFVAPNLSKVGRNNWKGKKGTDNRKDPRRIEKPMSNASMSGPTSSGGYKPPTLHELQSQNRLKARKFYQKKKFNNRFAPYAPRNTTSFIIRAKKAGGIASLVSPCPVTPAVLPTPIFSPSREVLGDMAKEEWGVDGYGSMKGLIRLRSPGDEEEGGGGSSDSDVEEHVEVERRLDHDLSRFEMIYPNYSGVEYNNVLENRVDDQDTHIAQLEEENLTLKERLFIMERELGDLRRRLQFLERQHHIVEEFNEEVVENGSENESEGGSEAPPMSVSGKKHHEVYEYMSKNGGSRNPDVDAKEEPHDGTSDNVQDVCMVELHNVINSGNNVRDEFVRDEDNAQMHEGARNELTRGDVIADEGARNEFARGEVVAEKDEEAKTEFMVDKAASGKDGSSKN
ncbi:hypothetical protein FNV43_RR03048 [Rhamnella rubrinervis]|uniref:PRLI-interacting factor A n=1 Tax=Rhamnella rubrinervis TaxID=2594499 RepID=A0A8K0MP82_9ROSA|nr:hypothetical protein FNV43_RR03048 [Rhamnella rubrinervis]